MIEKLSTLFVLAVFVEGTVEYFVSNPDKKQPWLKYVSLVLAVAVCFAARVDLFQVLNVVWVSPIIGYIATGLIIGRGSNYLNDFVSKVRKPASTEVSIPKGISSVTATTEA